MREVIIETDAMIRFDSAVDEVAGADRMLSGFVLAYGQAGRGKSVAADRYHYQRGGAYVRVWQGWSQTAFLQRLLFEVRGKNMDMPRHTGNRCKELVVQLLEAEPKPIFIDEADRLRIDRIEDLRDIHEMTGAPVVLIGEEGIFGLLHERRRIWSRIAYEVEFGPVSPAEIALYAQQAAGLDLPLSLSTEIAQKTEDLVGPYELHDFFLYYVVRFGLQPKKIFQLAQLAFADDFDDDTLRKWLKNFYRRFFNQQFKRNCMPDGVKIGSIALSPRGDWRMPSEAESALWLAACEQL